jgi:dsRNA-specific ribonuclease
MTVLRSKIVSEQPLARAVDNLGIIDYLRCGVGESKNAVKPQSIKADLFEAIVAAIYLDSGDIRYVEKFVLTNLNFAIEDALKENAITLKEQKPYRKSAQKQPQTIPSKQPHTTEAKQPQAAPQKPKQENAPEPLTQKQKQPQAQTVAHKPLQAQATVEQKPSQEISETSTDAVHKKEKSRIRAVFEKRREKKPEQEKEKPVSAPNHASAQKALKPAFAQSASVHKDQKQKTSNPPIQENQSNSSQKAFNDYKSRVQSLAQRHGQKVEYKTVNAGGPPHKPVFKSVLLLNGIESGTGTGQRVKDAEQMAAKAALERK